MQKEQYPRLRRSPYPYRAMMSISSDIDCTNTLEKFLKIQNFMTQEIGINFTNTFFPFNDDKMFSLMSGSTKDREAIIKYIHNGEIDAIHSFGEKRDFCRSDARKAIAILKANNCNLRVWIDHAESASNLCKYRYNGKGDIKDGNEYHFDLLKEYGIRYIWTEKLSNIIGQDVNLKLNDILKVYDSLAKRKSSTQLLKTVIKIFLSQYGYKKYAFFKGNKLVFKNKLFDNNEIFEFVRFNNHFEGASIGDTFEDLWYLISKKVLKQLKINKGYCIVYTHLGKRFDPNSTMGKRTKKSLINLNKEASEKKILLVSVSSILDYVTTLKYLDWKWTKSSGETIINIRSIKDPLLGKIVPTLDKLKNISFYVNGPVKVFIAGKEIETIKYNPADYTNKFSITIE